RYVKDHPDRLGNHFALAGSYELLALGSLEPARAAEVKAAVAQALGAWEKGSTGGTPPPALETLPLPFPGYQAAPLGRTGKVAEAEASVSAVLPDLRKASEARPTDHKLAGLLAQAVSLQGDLLKARGRYKDAEEPYQKAAALAENLVKKHPDELLYRRRH